MQSGLGEMDTRAWVRLHLIDIVTLVLGTALTLRFWYLFFGIDGRPVPADAELPHHVIARPGR